MPVAVAVLAVWNSYFTIPAESEGVVLRFGKFMPKGPPGLHFKIPFGVDQVTVVPTRRQEIEEAALLRIKELAGLYQLGGLLKRMERNDR